MCIRSNKYRLFVSHRLLSLDTMSRFISAFELLWVTVTALETFKQRRACQKPPELRLALMNVI